jgi:hypothetical protein
MVLEPLGKNIYLNSQGATSITITPQNQIKLNSDGSINFFDINNFFPPVAPVIQVIVNEYYTNEIPLGSYPTSLSRTQSWAPPNPTIITTPLTGVTSFSQAFGTSSFLQGQNLWLAGLDFSGQVGSAVVSHEISINNIGVQGALSTANTLKWYAYSNTTQGPFISIRGPWPLINASSSKSALTTIAIDTLTSAKKYWLTVYFFLQ